MTVVGGAPGDKRFISGTISAFCSWLLTSGPTPFCLCKPFSCKACPGIIRLSTAYQPVVNSRTGGVLESMGGHNSVRVPPPRVIMIMIMIIMIMSHIYIYVYIYIYTYVYIYIYIYIRYETTEMAAGATATATATGGGGEPPVATRSRRGRLR